MEPPFEIGQRVRTKVVNPAGHCRLPRYARGRVGTIERIHGSYPLADRAAKPGADPRREPVYIVRFTARELWGDGEHTVSVDVWQSYLEPARLTTTQESADER